LRIAFSQWLLVRIFYASFNVHYFPPGEKYFNANGAIMLMQNAVLATKFEGLSDEIVKYTHSH